MSSPLARADGTRFDALVLGGSLEGLLTTLELSMRGYRALLVEPRDVGWGGASFASRQLVAGRHALALGVRDAFRARLAERLAWAHLAPHAVRATPVLVAEQRAGGGPWSAYRDALCRLVARVSSEARAWPGPMPLSAENQRVLAPGFAPADGGTRPVVYGATVDDRLLAVLLARAATARGAVVATRCELLRVDSNGHGCAHASLRDSLGGELARVEARALIDASGWWWERARDASGLPPSPSPSPPRRRIFALVPHALHAIVVSGRDADGQPPTTLTPAFGGLLAGPLTEVHEGSLDALASSVTHRARLEALVARALPDAEPIEARAVFASLDRGARAARRLSVERSEGIPLLTLPHVAFPHERALARATADRLASLGVAPALDATRPLARLDGGELASVAGLESSAVADGLSAGQARWLVARHGSAWDEVLDGVGDAGRVPLGGGPAPLRAEVSWALRREDVRTLSDLLFRWRAPEITIDDATEAALVADTGAALAEDAGWSSARLERELLRWRRERAIVYGSGAEQTRVTPMRPRPDST